MYFPGRAQNIGRRIAAVKASADADDSPELALTRVFAGASIYTLKRVLGDEALRASLVCRGRERVKAFSWQRSVARVREVYAELVGSVAHA